MKNATRQLTRKEALSIDHDTTNGTGEVELGSLSEENRKLAQQSNLHQQEFNTPIANVPGMHRATRSVYGDQGWVVEQL
jgi:hypothetical protein